MLVRTECRGEADIIEVAFTKDEWETLEELTRQVTDDPHSAPDLTDKELVRLAQTYEILSDPTLHGAKLFVMVSPENEKEVSPVK